MEFWGIEVKSGQLFEVNLGEGKVLHLSQASLGEIKKGNESVCLHVTVEGKKLVLGTLHSERLPQQLFDLVFDKDFQISHNWKNGSVYFYGYKADQPIDDHDESEDFDSEDEEEDLQLQLPNGKQEAKKEEKAAVSDKKDGAAKGSATGKQKVKIVEPEKDAKADSDDDDDSDDSDAMSEDSDSEEDNNDSSDDDDEEDYYEEEETPKKQQSGKKRSNESAKTPSTDKKAKVAVTPQKTEGKKGGVHVATPHPSKQAAAKTPANKSNQKSPASEGAHSCKPCNRTFKSENALQSHNQAKHK